MKIVSNKKEKTKFFTVLEKVAHDDQLKQKALKNSMLREMYAKKYEQSKQDKLVFKDQIEKKIQSTLAELVELKNKIYTKLTNEAIGLSLTEMNELLDKYSRELRYFKILDEEFVKLLDMRHTSPITSSFYDSLFLDLSNTNPNFMFFTPLKAFTHGYDNKQIPIETKHMFSFVNLDSSFIKKFERNFEHEDKKLQKNNPNYVSVFKNKYFIANYIRYFPNQIKSFTSVKDINVALSIDPEKFSEVSIKLNPKTISSFIRVNRKLIVYLNNDQLETLATTSNTFAYALLDYPEIIYKLSPDFFLNRKHLFIHVFERIPYKELVKHNETMSYFIGWEGYINMESKLTRAGNKVHKRKTQEEKMAEIKAQLEDTTPID